jgi:hypothetical protein
MSILTHAGSETQYAPKTFKRAALLQGRRTADNGGQLASADFADQLEMHAESLPADGADDADGPEALSAEATEAAPPDDYSQILGETQQPKVVYVSHKHGPASGGTTVTILGNYFTNVGEVLFGQVAAEYKVVSTNRIVAVAPPQDPGVVDLRISTGVGVSAAVPFTYQAVPVLTELKPNHGPTRGGTLVIVHGANFVAGQTKVFLGKRQGKDVKLLSSRLLVFRSPPGEAGTVPVVIATPDGVSCEEAFVYA